MYIWAHVGFLGRNTRRSKPRSAGHPKIFLVLTRVVVLSLSLRKEKKSIKIIIKII